MRSKWPSDLPGTRGRAPAVNRQFFSVLKRHPTKASAPGNTIGVKLQPS
jgi:hypothetical protein